MLTCDLIRNSICKIPYLYIMMAVAVLCMCGICSGPKWSSFSAWCFMVQTAHFRPFTALNEQHTRTTTF